MNKNKLDITLEGLRIVAPSVCLMPTCDEPALLIHQDDYLGAQVSWCKMGHVSCCDPEKDTGPVLAHDFRAGYE